MRAFAGRASLSAPGGYRSAQEGLPSLTSPSIVFHRLCYSNPELLSQRAKHAVRRRHRPSFAMHGMPCSKDFNVFSMDLNKTSSAGHGGDHCGTDGGRWATWKRLLDNPKTSTERKSCSPSTSIQAEIWWLRNRFEVFGTIRIRWSVAV